MKDSRFLLSMTKGDLAALYFPESLPRTALRHLTRWINGCPPLLADLFAIGYRIPQKRFTARQVALIVHYLGEPE